MPSWASWLLFSGCTVTSSWSECEAELSPIEDHELAGELELTPADVLGLMEGSHPFEARYDEGPAVTGSVGVARGPGPALFTRRTLVHYSTRRTGFSPTPMDTQMGHICEDGLEIPVDLRLSTDDGLYRLALAALAEPALIDSEGVRRFDAHGYLDPEAEDTLALFVQFVHEGFEHVSLQWEGEDDFQILQGGSSPPALR